MLGHAVAAGLIGYINTNISLEREEGKDYFLHLPLWENTMLQLQEETHHILAVAIMKDDTLVLSYTRQLDALM